MARIRTVKPTFFTSEDTAALSWGARLTWLGLWTYCDDRARGKANPLLIKAALWPLDEDVTSDVVETFLDELEANERIRRYVVDGKPYLEVSGLLDHQRIDKPQPSKLPAPPWEHSENVPGTVEERSRLEGKGREEERKGGGALTRPAPFCSKHPQGTDEPCRACGNARRISEAWTPPPVSTPTPPPLSEVLRRQAELIGEDR